MLLILFFYSLKKQTMQNLGMAFWLFTIIALVIGAVLVFCVTTKETKELTPDDQHNTTRATLFLLLGILVALIIIVFQMEAMVKAMTSMVGANQ